MIKKIRAFLKSSPILLVGAGIATLVCCKFVSFAWFASTDATENNFQAAFSFKVNLVDAFEEPTAVVSNQRLAKKVAAKNTGDLAAFVRVMVFPVILGPDRLPLPTHGEVEVELNELNTSNWLAGEDGYYYYLDKLLPSEETPALFEGVTLHVGADSHAAYENATLEIEVKSEAVDIRKNEYRYSWWQTTRETAPTSGQLKVIDDSLQEVLTE